MLDVLDHMKNIIQTVESLEEDSKKLIDLVTLSIVVSSLCLLL